MLALGLTLILNKYILLGIQEQVLYKRRIDQDIG